MTLHAITYTRPGNHFAAARCSRCRRPLTDPDSIRLGMGPECRAQSGGVVDNGLCKRDQFSDQFSDQFDNAIPFERALVLRRTLRPVLQDTTDPVGGVITNVPHLVVHHSPDGYEFGYGGSGPADLALNCCQLYLNLTGYEGKETKCYDGNCWSLAYSLHQYFKTHFIASAPKTGRLIPFAELDAWFRTHITSELLAQYSIAIEKEL